jgi:hypothetical protein
MMDVLVVLGIIFLALLGISFLYWCIRIHELAFEAWPDTQRAVNALREELMDEIRRTDEWVKEYMDENECILCKIDKENKGEK